MSTDRRIDRKGRVTIPKEIRDRLDIDPGEPVRIELQGGDIVIRREVDRSDAVDALEGCINEETRRSAAEEITPDDLKRDWTSDL